MSFFQKVKKFLLRNERAGQTIIKNLFWLSIGQVVSRGVRGVAIIYIARSIGAANYGVFAYILGLAGFFTIFADIGLNTILTRETAKNIKEGGRYFATIFWLKAILLAFTVILVVLVAPFFSRIPAATALLWLAAIITLIDGLRDLSIAFFRAHEKMELEALVNTITNVSILFAAIIALMLTKNAKAGLVAYLLSDSLGLAAALILLRREFLGVFKNFAGEYIKPIVRSAGAIAIITLAGMFAINLDVIMLGWWRSSTEIGFYSAGQRIVQLFFTIPSIVAGSIMPMMSRLAMQKDNERLKKLFEYGTRIVLTIALPLTAGGVILGREIIAFLYGSDYLSAVPSFRVFVILITIYFLMPIFTSLILAFDAQKKLIKPTLTASLSNAIFNSLLIPKLGAVGAAMATLGSQSIFLFFLWKAAGQLVDFEIRKYLTKITASTVIMGLGTWSLNFLGVHLVINVLLSVGVYFAVFFYLDKEAREKILGWQK